MNNYRDRRSFLSFLSLFGILFYLASFTYAETQPGAVRHSGNVSLKELENAIARGNLEAVKSYLDHGGNVDQSWKDTPYSVNLNLWQRAIWRGKYEIFHFLIGKGAKVNPSDPETLSALKIATRHCNLSAIQELVQRGVKISEVKDIYAAAFESKNLECLKYVLKNGPELDLTDRNNLPMSDITDDMVRFLIPTYVSPNLEIYLDCGARALLRPGKRSEGCGGDLNPIWMEYVYRGHVDMVKFLSERGADLNRLGEVSWSTGESLRFSAMDLAKAKKDSAMIEFLQSRHVKPSSISR
jgi:hypothetical protein